MREMTNTRPPNMQIVAQNFGPIEKAEIPLRPLTIFVGESNTGKTYLSTLIFALHRACELQQKAAEKYRDVFREELKRCFGVASLSELIRFTGNSCDEMKIALRCCADTRTDWGFHLHASEGGITIDGDAFAAAHRLCAAAEHGQNRAYYLPAGRRGIMQTHAAIVGSHNGASQKQILPSGTTGLLTDFLQPLVGYQERNGAADEMPRIAEALETEVLRGAIERKRPIPEGYPEFHYRPQQEARAIRLSEASSMVSELAPLVLFLRHAVRPGDLLIIEEPEAHLHPAAQDKLAYTFARLIRAGVRVMVTTHSDWFLQRLGILIREGEVMKLGKSITEPVNWLVKEEVGTWWFRRNEPVVEIPFNRANGIEPQDYYDVADELYNGAAGLQYLLQEEETTR